MDNKINPIRGAAKFMRELAEMDHQIVLGSTELSLLADLFDSVIIFDDQDNVAIKTPSIKQDNTLSAPPRLCILCGSDMYKTKCDWICTGCSHTIKGECG